MKTPSSLLLSLATAVASLSALGRGAPLLPSQDPFYTPPANVSSYAPGEVMRTRNVGTNVSGLIVGNTTLQVSAAYQYLYRTTDSLGKAVAAVTTLLVPKNNPNPRKLLSYQTAYDSTDRNCVPSYELQAGGNATTSLDIVFIAAALDQGWYVVTSDYEGLQVQLLTGLQSAHATLDSVRAAFHETATSGLSPNATYGMFGYSGGSFASEWAAEVQGSYAPELKFAGMAIGGLPSNVTDALLAVNGTNNAQLAFVGTRGYANAFANFSSYLNTHIKPSMRAQFDNLSVGCFSKGLMAGAGQDFFSYFDNGVAVLTDPVPSSVLNNEGIMGRHGKPLMPTFIYKGVEDEIVPINTTDTLVNYYCNVTKGVTIEYQRDVIGNHESEALLGSAKAFSWIKDRLDGIPVANPGKCNVTYVALTAADLGTFEAFGDVFVALLKALFGGPTGPPFSG